MDINIAKLLSACLLALFRFSLGRLPIRIHDIINGNNKKMVDDGAFRKRIEKFDFHMIILRSFGSGVFLCTCLIHLMPEVVQLLCDGYDKNQINKTDGLISSLAQLYICVGFFIIYFIEEFCHWIITKVPTIPISSRLAKGGNMKFQQSVNYIEERSHSSETSGKTALSCIEDCETKSKKNLSKSYSNILNEISTSETEVTQQKHSENNPNKRQFVSFVFSGTGVVLHAFFEGIAIGLQHKEAANVWFLTIAMMIHSATSLFCVGMRFLALRASKRSIFIHFIIQAAASPAGILVGYSILVGGKLDQTLLIDGYFEALSTGTILYITFFESLSKEKQMRVLRVCRSISMISGFSVMCALEYFIFLEKSVLSGQYVELKSLIYRNQSDDSVVSYV